MKLTPSLRWTRGSDWPRTVKSYQLNFDLTFLNNFTSFLLAARTEATPMQLHDAIVRATT
jgi:hypothetical protein